jgi:hypothetical protein
VTKQEAEVLQGLRRDVARAAERLDPASPWAQSLSEIDGEIDQTLAEQQFPSEPVSLPPRLAQVASQAPALQLVT